MKKILIIEDDRDIAELIAYNLSQEKMASELCANGAVGLKKAKTSGPSLVILDLMLPDVGGLEICKILKADPKTQSIPILMLTAKGTEVDRIVGFEVGADDYLTKPFSPRELVLRVKAILKRSTSPQESSGQDKKAITFGLLTIDPTRFAATVSGQPVRLTAIEFKLILYFLENKGRIATRDNLLDKVWGYEAALTTRTVDTHIKRLREKLGKAGDYIETVHGVGYRFQEKV